METFRIRIEDADPNGRVKKYKEKRYRYLLKLSLAFIKDLFNTGIFLKNCLCIYADPEH